MRKITFQKCLITLATTLALVVPTSILMAAAPPGTLQDPLVTKQYIENYLRSRFLGYTQQLSDVDGQLMQIETKYQQVMQIAGPYPDIIGHWAQKEVAYLANLKVVAGSNDGNFYPNNKVTRAQLAVMLVRAKGLNTNDAIASFSDVQSNYWAVKEIAAAKSAGIISGYENNQFKPEKLVSRQEIAAMIARAYTFDPATNKVKLTDVQNSWAKDVVQQLADNGIISGYQGGVFKPKDTATRAEIAAILGRVLDPTKRLKN